MGIHLLAFVLISLFQGSYSAQFTSSSPTDDSILYVCATNSLTLDWNYTLDPGDTVGDLQWFFQGRSQEMIAISAHGNFLAMPSFANRVHFVDNAGVGLSKLSPADSGNYSVEIHVYGESGTHAVLHKSVRVQVKDALSQDDQVQISQSGQPVLDKSSDQWAIQLTCGNFVFNGPPPFNVQWITPSGSKLNTSNFNNGHFDLLLTSPIKGGNYTCVIPNDHTCTHDNSAQQREATIYVDGVEARLSLLEKENEQLKQKLKISNDELTQVKSLVTTEMTQLKQNQSNVMDELRHVNKDLTKLLSNQSLMTNEVAQLSQSQAVVTDELTQLMTNQSLMRMTVTQLNSTIATELTPLKQSQAFMTSELTHVSGLVHSLEARQGQQVGFHAWGLKSSSPATNSPLIVNNIEYNIGNAYDSSTGYFTAPYPGLYFFIASTGSDRLQRSVNHYLYVDNTAVNGASSSCDSSGHCDSASVHGVVHVTAGQRVWIKSGGGTFSNEFTSFSGCLVTSDP